MKGGFGDLSGEKVEELVVMWIGSLPERICQMTAWKEKLGEGRVL